jgi:hypothetical protein
VLLLFVIHKLGWWYEPALCYQRRNSDVQRCKIEIGQEEKQRCAASVGGCFVIGVELM